MIVEDNPSAALELEMMLEEMGHKPLAKIDNGKEAIANIQEEEPDLIILDIDLIGDMNGIEVARQVSSLRIPLIFITGHRERPVFEDAQSVNPLGYLTKPLDQLMLESLLSYAAKQYLTLDEFENMEAAPRLMIKDSVLVKRNTAFHRIKVEDIAYIQSDGNYCTIHTHSRKYVLKSSLRKLLEKLSSEIFSPIHKRYLVNLGKLDSVDFFANVVVVGGDELPLGRHFRQSLMERFEVLK